MLPVSSPDNYKRRKQLKPRTPHAQHVGLSGGGKRSPWAPRSGPGRSAPAAAAPLRENAPEQPSVWPRLLHYIGSYSPFRELLYRLRVKIANLCQTRAPCNGSYLGVFHHLEEKVTAKRNWKSSGAPTP